MYLVNFIDGPLKGERFLPELKHYWYFRLSTGNKIICYWLTSKQKQTDDSKVINNNPKNKAKKEKKIQATYKHNPTWIADITHQDVQQFITWHENKYGRKPESIFP